jgi:hypothetical protein
MIIKQTSLLEEKNPFVVFENLLLERAHTFAPVTTGANAGENVLNTRTNISWNAENVSELVLSLDTPDTGVIDTICIASHNLHNLTGANVFVTVEEFDGTTWNILVGTSPTTADPIVFLIEPQTSELRVRLSTTTPSVLVKIANIMFGQRTIIPGSVLHPFTSLREDSDSKLYTNESWKGHFLGAVVAPMSASGTVRFTPLLSSWVQAEAFKDFQASFNSGEPFYLAIGQAQAPEEIYYCWRDSRPLVPEYNRNPLYRNVEIEVRSFVHGG